MENNDKKYLFVELVDKTYLIIEISPFWAYSKIDIKNNCIIPITVIDSETDIRKNGWLNLYYVKTIFEMSEEDLIRLKEHYTLQKAKNLYQKDKDDFLITTDVKNKKESVN